MYRYRTEDTFDEPIACILRFLFVYQPVEQKQQLYIPAYTLFMQLDLAAHYFLFSLIGEQLPRRAKLFFVAEDYQGKKEMIVEIMQHWLGQELPKSRLIRNNRLWVLYISKQDVALET